MKLTDHKYIYADDEMQLLLEFDNGVTAKLTELAAFVDEDDQCDFEQVCEHLLVELPWQPISTAPKDGTVVLTDVGLCRIGWDHKGWCHCDDNGGIFSCANEGPYTASPKFWKPFNPPME